ncbi:unnamed protein product [Pleuronectes platessa]|uniref:Uncharacterized protein n=1 Tax=Pleuronectes platessa TaxID=8262 RepID=A0A9N7UE28_PLEPL|nr:unnamed protein product [Pleuronectes platessa]
MLTGSVGGAGRSIPLMEGGGRDAGRERQPVEGRRDGELETTQRTAHGQELHTDWGTTESGYLISDSDGDPREQEVGPAALGPEASSAGDQPDVQSSGRRRI